jgi:hypothetical protein
VRAGQSPNSQDTIMQDFFQWISGNPIATAIVLVGLGLGVLICIVAFLQNREIKVFGLVIGSKPSGSRQMVQIGDEPFPEKDSTAHLFYERTYKGRVTVTKAVNFDPPFKTQPRVSVSLQLIDLGDPKDSCKINRLKVYARQITPKGFEMCFETWDDSVVWNAAASWIAIGE